MVIESIDVEATFHEEKVNKGKFSENKVGARLTIDVLTNFFNIFSGGEVFVKNKGSLLIELTFFEVSHFIHHLHHSFDGLRLFAVIKI